MYRKCKTVHLEMAKGEQEEEVNQASVVSYFKSLTLEKKYGTTGAIEMEQGAVYIGKIDFFCLKTTVLQKNFFIRQTSEAQLTARCARSTC